MANPLHTTTVATNLSLKLWRESAETWISAASGWWGLAPQSQEKGPRTESDRRFDAPEWEQHPFFRLLKQSYLAISDQLLEEAGRDTLDPAERLRLMFHVRQLVDATSPTLFLQPTRQLSAGHSRRAAAAWLMACATLLPICARVG